MGQDFYLSERKLAFRIAGRRPAQPEGEVQLACWDAFGQSPLLHRIIPTIEEVLLPRDHEEAVEMAIPNKGGFGDAGHRGWKRTSAFPRQIGCLIVVISLYQARPSTHDVTEIGMVSQRQYGY